MMIAIDNHSSFGNHLFRLRTRINFPEQILLLGDVRKIENDFINQPEVDLLVKDQVLP